MSVTSAPGSRRGADLPSQRADGAPLVKACAENGVHYVDLTGEAPFIAGMIKVGNSPFLDGWKLTQCSCRPTPAPLSPLEL